jgi:uncharacterized membrane protein
MMTTCMKPGAAAIIVALAAVSGILAQEEKKDAMMQPQGGMGAMCT